MGEGVIEVYARTSKIHRSEHCIITKEMENNILLSLYYIPYILCCTPKNLE